MKIKENEIKNKKVKQIYLTKEEIKNIQIQKNEKYINSVVFVSGNNEITEILKEMIKIMKNEETITD